MRRGAGNCFEGRTERAGCYARAGDGSYQCDANFPLYHSPRSGFRSGRGLRGEHEPEPLRPRWTDRKPQSRDTLIVAVEFAINRRVQRPITPTVAESL